MSKDPNKLTFRDIDAEATLAARIHVRTGKDLYAGITGWNDRKAAGRIAIVMGKVKAEFAQEFERVYGEPLVIEKQSTESNA